MRTTTLTILNTAVLGCLFALSSPLALAQLGEKPSGPSFVRLDNFLIVISPQGDKVASFNVKTGKTDVLRLSKSNDTRIEVTPIVGPGVVAFALKGPKITRIAACDGVTGALIPQDLREPVEGRVMPIVGPDVAAYVTGRYAYAFSPALNRWDVVELAAGHGEFPEVGSGHATVSAPGHIYTFSSKTARWDHISVDDVFGNNKEAVEQPTDSQK
jgi:hypothetical protein